MCAAISTFNSNALYFSVVKVLMKKLLNYLGVLDGKHSYSATGKGLGFSVSSAEMQTTSSFTAVLMQAGSPRLNWLQPASTTSCISMI